MRGPGCLSSRPGSRRPQLADAAGTVGERIQRLEVVSGQIDAVYEPLANLRVRASELGDQDEAAGRAEEAAALDEGLAVLAKSSPYFAVSSALTLRGRSALLTARPAEESRPVAPLDEKHP